MGRLRIPLRVHVDLFRIGCVQLPLTVTRARTVGRHRRLEHTRNFISAFFCFSFQVASIQLSLSRVAVTIPLRWRQSGIVFTNNKWGVRSAATRKRTTNEKFQPFFGTGVQMSVRLSDYSGTFLILSFVIISYQSGITCDARIFAESGTWVLCPVLEMIIQNRKSMMNALLFMTCSPLTWMTCARQHLETLLCCWWCCFRIFDEPFALMNKNCKIFYEWFIRAYRSRNLRPNFTHDDDDDVKLKRSFFWPLEMYYLNGNIIRHLITLLGRAKTIAVQRRTAIVALARRHNVSLMESQKTIWR